MKTVKTFTWQLTFCMLSDKNTSSVHLIAISIIYVNIKINSDKNQVLFKLWLGVFNRERFFSFKFDFVFLIFYGRQKDFPSYMNMNLLL